MLCSSQFSIGLIGTAYFVGETFGAIIFTFLMTRLTDGRLPILRVRMIANFIVLLGYLILPSHPINLFLLNFCLGFLSAIGHIFGYPYSCEMVSDEDRNFIGSAGHMIDKEVNLIVLILIYLFDISWSFVIYPAIILAFIGYFLTLILPDSPKLYHDEG